LASAWPTRKNVYFNGGRALGSLGSSPASEIYGEAGSFWLDWRYFIEKASFVFDCLGLGRNPSANNPLRKEGILANVFGHLRDFPSPFHFRE
jgi:hypothetical protein